MCFSIMCIMKLVFIKIDCCDIVVKLLRDYCETPVGLWLLAAHASTTRCTTVAANRGVSSESKRRGAHARQRIDTKLCAGAVNCDAEP